MTAVQFPADLVTFTEKILNGKLHFLCSAILFSLKVLLQNLCKQKFEWNECVSDEFK